MGGSTAKEDSSQSLEMKSLAKKNLDSGIGALADLFNKKEGSSQSREMQSLAKNNPASDITSLQEIFDTKDDSSQRQEGFGLVGVIGFGVACSAVTAIAGLALVRRGVVATNPMMRRLQT